MKTKPLFERILILIFLFFIFSVSAQEYCDYNEQTTYHFGGDITSDDKPVTILEKSDGKILAIGSSGYGDLHNEVSILRLNADQSPDETFGENGKVGISWAFRNEVSSALLQDDGKILIGGLTSPDNGVLQIRPFIARILNDGSPDPSFGDGGVVNFNEPPFDVGHLFGIKQLENGKIMAVATIRSPNRLVFMRLDEFGVIDITFGNNGLLIHETNLSSLVYSEMFFLEDGTSFVVGKTLFSGNPVQLKIVVEKFTSEVEYDSSFAINGTLIIDKVLSNGSICASEITANNNILIASSGASSKKYLLYKVDGIIGELDSDFGTGGMVASAESGWNEVEGMNIDPNTGDIYVLGKGNPGWAAALWRVSSAGVEISGCDGGDPLQSFPYPGSLGFYAALFHSSGSTILLGVSSARDTSTTTPDNVSQGNNFMIPRNSLATGIDEDQEVTFSLYPNPVINVLNIEIENNMFIDVVNIYNQLGQQVFQKNNVEQAIDISNLQKGIYIIELVSGNSTFRKKMIKS